MKSPVDTGNYEQPYICILKIHESISVREKASNVYLNENMHVDEDRMNKVSMTLFAMFAMFAHGYPS
jgi:hypothetical protein